MRNKFTPWTQIAPDHFLIIPHQCWKKEELLNLGGKEKIAAVLFMASNLVRENAHSKFLLCVHVGRSAGQNVCHAHFHMLPLPIGTSAIDGSNKDKPQLKQSDEKFSVFCDGTRAGQCFVVPKNHAAENKAWEHFLDYGEKIEKILGLYRTKFCSTQRLPPDFLMNAILWKGNLKYATTIPILN